MRQGETAPKGGWIGNATGGVKAPEPILLPDPAIRFARTAERLALLSQGHPMEGWLDFMAKLFAPEDLDFMKRLRQAFNPENRCSPGKLFPTAGGCTEHGGVHQTKPGRMAAV